MVVFQLVIFLLFWCFKDMDRYTEIVADAYDQQYFLPKRFLAKVPLVVHKYLVRNNLQVIKFVGFLFSILEQKIVKIDALCFFAIGRRTL